MIARFYLVRFAMSTPFEVAVSLVASTLDLRRTISLRKQMADHCLSASRALPVMESASRRCSSLFISSFAIHETRFAFVQLE